MTFLIQYPVQSAFNLLIKTTIQKFMNMLKGFF